MKFKIAHLERYIKNQEQTINEYKTKTKRILNPISGRLIYKGTRTHKRLIREGIVPNTL